MLVNNLFKNIIDWDFADASELTDTERQAILNHICSVEARWNEYDSMVNGAPKKGISPVYSDRQVVRCTWSYKYAGGYDEDDTSLVNTYQSALRELRPKQVTISRYLAYGKPFLEVIV